MRSFGNSLLVALIITVLSACGGGSGAGSVGDAGGGGGDGGDAIGEPTVSSVQFDFEGAVGLALSDSNDFEAMVAKDAGSGGGSNLKKVKQDNTLADAVASGTLYVQNFMVAENDNVYLLLAQPVLTDSGDQCILLRVKGSNSESTNETTCVDNTLWDISWSNGLNDPIQFDCAGNIYYTGYANGNTVLRMSSDGEITDLINDNISLNGFRVMCDGSVLYAGMTSSTGVSWTRVISPQHAVQNLLEYSARILPPFPDNNIYLSTEDSAGGIQRYLTATNELDPTYWTRGPGGNSYFDYDSNFPSQVFNTMDGTVYGKSGGGLFQYYPVVKEINTTISDLTIVKGVLTNLIMAGVDAAKQNRMILYNTSNDKETDLLGDADIEVYHANYLASNASQVVMFDGLRFSDNQYVLCQVNLTSANALTCAKTGMSQLTDFQLFHNDFIPGGSMGDTKTYLIGGNATGLYGTLILENVENDDSVELSKMGSFNFPVAVSGEYSITVKSNPAGQECVVADGSGAVSDKHVTDVAIECSMLSGYIQTVAGGGSLSDDGVYATDAYIWGDNWIAFDSSGNLYYSGSESKIRKINADGLVSTVAGIGSAGYSGDGGLAVEAMLSSPRGIAFDSSGNLYVADSGNFRIRRIDTNGVISTVAGIGTGGFSGDSGLAVDAEIQSVYGIAFDSSDNLYIADSENNRIRKIVVGGNISTVAGSGDYGYSGDSGPATDAKLRNPRDVAFDSHDNLFIADTLSSRIRKVSGGTIETVAGTGVAGFSGDGALAVDAMLNYPYAVALDSADNLYIGDSTNYRVRMVDVSGKITTFAGTGTGGLSGDGGLAVEANLSAPRSIAVNALDDIFFTDNTDRIRVVGH